MQLQVSSLHNSAVTFTHQFLGYLITTQSLLDLKSYKADTIKKEPVMKARTLNEQNYVMSKNTRTISGARYLLRK